MKQRYIYALTDPDTNEVRYVGRSTDPAARLVKHYSEKVGRKKMAWVGDMKRRGVRPVLFLLEKCTEEESLEAENKWISYFLERGARLVNTIYRGYDCHILKGRFHE